VGITHFVIKDTFRKVGFSSPQKGHKFSHEPWVLQDYRLDWELYKQRLCCLSWWFWFGFQLLT